MATYKLTYFNIRELAEPIRLIFAYADVPFVNNELEATKWPELKKTIKWGQLPILEHDGKTLTQSTAIAVFLGKKFGLEPKDIWDQARCDELIGAIMDLRLKIKPLGMAKLFGIGADKIAETKKELMDTAVPLFLENLSDILAEVRKGDPSRKGDFILGGSKPTTFDFHLAHFTEQWEGYLDMPDLLDKYPLLKKQREALYSLPKVAEYIKHRPAR